MLFRPMYTLGFILTVPALSCLLSSCSDKNPKPPIAEKKPFELKEHGNVRIDNYYWLRDRDNPRVIKYLEAENQFARSWFAPHKKLQEKLYSEFTGRIKQDDETFPFKYNGYYYYNRYENEEEYPLFCRKKDSLLAVEEVMMNVNELAQKHSYCSVLTYSVSPNNKLFAYGIDTVGRRKYTIQVLDLATGKTLADALPVTSGNPIWADDNKTIFYSRIDSTTLRSCYIYKHRLGTDPARDQMIYEEKDPTFETLIYKTKSDKYLLISSYSKISNEYQFLEASNPDGQFRMFSPRKEYLDYEIDHCRDKFIIRTNYNSENFRLMEAPVNNTSREHWKEIYPTCDSIFLESFEVFNNFIVLQERRNGLMKLEILDQLHHNSYLVNFGEETYDLSFFYRNSSLNMEMNTDELHYYYSSLTTPSSIYNYNMVSRERILLKQDEVLGGFDSKRYEAKRTFAIAPDGTRIPISFVYRKDLYKPDMPLVLYGYGAYGNSADPDFNPVRFSLLDRGFIYAIAHVRGGEELGHRWYDEGKMLNKKNTFNDFVSCAEYLIKSGYTKPNHLFAMGRSAGGLLMGTVANMRPELFKGIIAGVPFVDIVSSMLDESIPLTTSEYEEWGDPRIRTYYDYMLSYSPYDNVKPVDYPAMFVTAGFHDSQVQYWEPAKWVAKLRATKTDQNPLLLLTNMEAGHGGATGRFEKYQQTALEYTFILNLLDIRQ
jgi:oligopeptidase B